ncbi:hypothetical protein COT48_06115 [Candidatus Woesearchaeota archaeon CG08_land_8_20_14_0_20_47_9]|nr:MAG: hypothetical protein AUJ69_00335 [Candidatus Woesearchaeota archaeon CG1_02_47_18]PIO03124.1 MAG: hypothetical protein COT48_06115 [Candidatus Woesearchaeota archaeon CG08_land_8_20_14_0_20_47_9]HII29912.1 hypothetical protein [Candidatus Woesearchaeota archaeon]
MTMAINFIKSIAEGKTDSYVHQKFVRYSMGEFEKEEFVIKCSGSSIQIQAGFEYVDALLRLIGELTDTGLEVEGVIVTTRDIRERLAGLSIEPVKITGKKYTIKEMMSREKFRRMLSGLSDCFLLLGVKAGSRSISVKQSIQKPGKLIEKFITARFERADYKRIKEEFLFDLKGDFKSAAIRHRYIVESIIVPEGLGSDPTTARIKAKRKGRIERLTTVDGIDSKTSIDFEA